MNAYIRLAVGVSMTTNIVECDTGALRIGDRVKLVFKPVVDETPLPMFTRAAG